MKGKLKLLMVFLSLMVVCSLAVSVKAEDTTKSAPMITYTINGKEETYQDGKKVYVNSVEVVFKVESSDEIGKVELFDTANDGVESYKKWSEIKLNENNEYTVGTSRVGDYYFQLRVLDKNNQVIAESDQVKVTVDRFEEEKDDNPNTETMTSQEHEHQWDEDKMIIKEPTLKNDGYAQIPCSVEGCDEYLELKLSLYSVEKEKYIFDSNKQKDMSFHIDSQGILITVGIDDIVLEEQDYTVSEDGQTVTIKKEKLAQLKNGTYEMSFIYLDMDYEALENMDIDKAEVEDLLKNVKMGVALTELEIINTKPQPSITVDEEKEIKKEEIEVKNEEKKKDEKSSVTKQKETNHKKTSSQKTSQENVKKIVQTDDDSPIIIYLGSMIIMGVALVALRRKKSA